MSLDCFLKEENIQKDTLKHKQALNIVKEAMQLRSSALKVKMAKEALDLCEECIEAYMLLASCVNAFERIEILKIGYEKNVLLLGKQFFMQEKEDYYEFEEAHDFFKIKYTYALALFESGYMKEALCQFEQILNLNPKDHFKVREYLYVLYLYFEDLIKLSKIMETYKDRTTLYVYILFFIELKKKNFSKAKEIIPLLKDLNSHLYLLITHQKLCVAPICKDAKRGSEEEANYVYSLLSVLLNIMNPVDEFLLNR